MEQDDARGRCEAAMRRGAATYEDVTSALKAAGLPAAFTQTGGMHAAIAGQLEAGCSLLVTDAEDALSRSRAAHEGWGVGLYREEIDEGALAFESTEDGLLESLLPLVRRVMRQRR